MKKLLVILGPTASGKSELALYLAKKYNGIIISADSRQIYKEMNIGTAKPSSAELKYVKHYLINIVKPSQKYTLADFQKDFYKTIKKIPANKLPILVGGTGLYISSIIEGYSLPKVKPDIALRKILNKKTTAQLLAQLKRLDPNSAKKINPHNKRYLIRAIEIAKSTKGKSRINNQTPAFDVLQLGLKIDRDVLYKRINGRVDNMINKGLIAEAKKLAKKYSWNLPAMSGIGYKQIGLFLRDKLSKQEAIDLIKRDTRHYAKRQLTWFRRDKNIHWITNRNQANRLTKQFLK